MSPDDDLRARLQSIFAQELDDQLRELNGELLELEKVPGDKDRLGAVFRVMHTLKGASRAAGLQRVEEMCHAVEGELGRARERGLALTPQQIALLFETADALAVISNQLQGGTPGNNAAVDTVLRHAGERPRAAPAAPRAPEPGPVAEVQATPAPQAEKSELRHSDVRVNVIQVDAIAGGAAEVAGLASLMHDRLDALGSVRTRLRGEGRNLVADNRREIDRELTALLRRMSEDARSLSTVSARLNNAVTRIRQRPVSELTESAPRVVRDLARELGKDVRLTILGAEIEVDRVVLEALREPLLHLVRNAIDHGIEAPAARTAAGKSAQGEVRVVAALRGDRLRLTVGDDGPGLDTKSIARKLAAAGHSVPADKALLARSILADGFTTRDTLSTVSGRGVGLGVVRVAAERMGGSVEIEDTPGSGTAITLDVPLNVATMRVLLVRVGDATLGVPSASVVRVLRVAPRSLLVANGTPMLVTKDAPVPVRSLAALLGPPFVEGVTPPMLQCLIVESSGRRLALIVDDLVDERELVLRPVENAGAAGEWSVGSALLGTGELALVLSVPALLAEGTGGSVGSFMREATREPKARARVLVADDSITSRTLEQSVLSAAGYDVITAVDGAAAWRILERELVAVVVSDVEMPNLDGYGLCERIRANERTARLPVILVTSLDEPQHRARGMAAGADAYLAKSSFDQDTLLETVRMLIGDHLGDSA